jgi:hypothetical protein
VWQLRLAFSSYAPGDRGISEELESFGAGRGGWAALLDPKPDAASIWSSPPCPQDSVLQDDLESFSVTVVTT